MKEFINKLIARLEEEKKYCSYHPHTRDEAINKAISIVNQLAEEYKSNLSENLTGWIPCSERLPENISTVLVQVKEIEKSTLGWYGNMDGWRLSEKDFAELENFTVIAWQPLPPAFKPKGE